MPACLHCPTFLWLPVFFPWCMFPTVGAFGPSVQPQPFARLHEACSKYRYAHPRSPTHRQWWIHAHTQTIPHACASHAHSTCQWSYIENMLHVPFEILWVVFLSVAVFGGCGVDAPLILRPASQQSQSQWGDITMQ